MLLLYLIVPKFGRFSFYVTVEQLFNVLHIILMSWNSFLNPALVPFLLVWVIDIFSLLFSRLVNLPYFFK